MDDDFRLSAVWLDTVSRDAAEQMALDEAMLDAARDGVHCLRLYRWRADAVSFGANEAATRHWNRASMEGDGLPVVRRPTGGRAVWHAAADLTYAWTGPVATLGGVRPAYALLHRRLAAAIAPATGSADLAPAPGRVPGLAAGACFDVPVGGEVLVGGRKAIGSAQLVRHDALLQHGAMAVADRSTALERHRRHPHPVTASATGALPPAGELAALIANFWCDRGARIASSELTSRVEAASLLLLPRYRDPAWIWRR